LQLICAAGACIPQMPVGSVALNYGVDERIHTNAQLQIEIKWYWKLVW
jgi:hypothetical protein